MSDLYIPTEGAVRAVYAGAPMPDRSLNEEGVQFVLPTQEEFMDRIEAFHRWLSQHDADLIQKHPGVVSDDTLAIAQDVLRGYGHDAIADALTQYTVMLGVISDARAELENEELDEHPYDKIHNAWLILNAVEGEPVV